ncbi:MAG: Ig-like domain-containing protein [Clostridia bacterium]|nr:Ig-like domain-containing protein [Clostridia bacterium]
MKQTVTNRVIALLSVLVLLCAFAVISFAGNGDGSGGGKDKPLTLASCSVPNGAQNVPENPKIVLTFSKNVVHFTVRDNNKKCFTLTDANGADVPINVIMGDDQVDPSIKRIVTVKPKSSLTPGMKYLLKIGAGVTSKSGVSLGRDNYVSFTVAGENTTKQKTTKETTAKASAVQTTAKTTTTKPSGTKPAATSATTTTTTAVTTQAASAQPTGGLIQNTSVPSTADAQSATGSVQTTSATESAAQAGQKSESSKLLYILIIMIPVAVGLTVFLIIKKKKS